MKHFLLFALAVLPLHLWSQSLTVTARVADAETGEALSFASVAIKGHSIGTISNANGEFDFHFPLELRDDTIVISMMGYENFEGLLRPLLDQPDQVLKMKKSLITLEEIVVSDTITAAEVMRVALSRIEQNYPMQPFLMDAFYRDVKKVGGTYISLLEAAVKIYDDDYAAPRNQHKLRERVRLIEVRKSMGYESKFTNYFDQANLLEDLLLENSIRYRHIDPADEYLETLRRERNSTFNGEEIYVVYNHDDSKLKVYISKKDFSIIHLEYQTETASMELLRKKNLISKFVGSKKVIDFKRINGKIFPSFFEMTTRINWYDVNSGALKFETELFQQLLINNVRTPVDERIGGTEKMRNYGLQYQDRPYNKEFWDNYNFIKETPLDRKIMADLEKVGPLEAQFADY